MARGVLAGCVQVAPLPEAISVMPYLLSLQISQAETHRVVPRMLACALGGLEGLHACAAPGQMHAARPARCLRGAGPAMQIGAELGNGELTYPFGLAARVGRDTYSDEWEEEEAYTPQVCHATQASNLRRADATDRPATHAVTL